MSEYQYHEWQCINRLLTPAEQEVVVQLSSHITVSASKAVVTYNWGDFRHDPKQVLLKYFDAYFYRADWGSLRLMFRFPKEQLDKSRIKPYLDGEMISMETVGKYDVLDISFNPEEGGWLHELSADLSDFISLQSDLLQGDYRLLYLSWLKGMVMDGDFDAETDEMVEDQMNVFEPPVPPGLNQLSPALENVVQILEIDPFLVQAAAEASEKIQPVDYSQLVGRLSRAECDDFLSRLAGGESTVAVSLRKRLSTFLTEDETVVQSGVRRSLLGLIRQADRFKEADNIRRAEVMRKNHVAEMKSLARREIQVWQEVDQLLEKGRKIASVYDEATALLEKLKQLADFQDARDIFFIRLEALAKKYSARSSLIERWRQRGWLNQ
jgi:hypothetical protein